MAWLTLCRSEDITEGGLGTRFSLGSEREGFVVRYQGVVRAYRNWCPHRGLELDWQPGQFFDEHRRVLMCAVHGAHYDPAGGHCLGGPCRGLALDALKCTEQEGLVFVEEGAL
jgi:nitrite reductase/ring-hydroxylating ferredoxin subunit